MPHYNRMPVDWLSSQFSRNQPDLLRSVFVSAPSVPQLTTASDTLSSVRVGAAVTALRERAQTTDDLPKWAYMG